MALKLARNFQIITYTMTTQKNVKIGSSLVFLSIETLKKSSFQIIIRLLIAHPIYVRSQALGRVLILLSATT